MAKTKFLQGVGLGAGLGRAGGRRLLPGVRPRGQPRPVCRPADTTFPGRENGRFWAENGPKNTKSEGKSTEFGHGNAKEGRSTSKAMDPRIKTYQNSQESQIEPKAI